MQQSKKIVILAGKGASTNIICNKLALEFDIAAVILEEPVPKSIFLKKRIKRLGILKVIGQILFQAIIVSFLNMISKKRIHQICTQHHLDDNSINIKNIINVSSVNDDSCLHSLQHLKPDLIIVNGTRIISKKILTGVNAIFINTHTGITPKYRGVHGGYWALANKDVQNCGVTVHMVDAGIDTGKILFQAKITPTSKDNFVTYPYLQLAAGIPILKEAIQNFITQHLQQQTTSGQSQLWYHPTLLQYLLLRLKGVK